MSRLIDADELIKAIENHKTNVASESGFANEIYALAHEHIIDVITIQPTAFDTEKVIEQLVNEKRYGSKYDYYYEENLYRGEMFENDVNNKTIDKAIDIVKKGGVE